jgi:hypothetical protein
VKRVPRVVAELVEEGAFDVEVLGVRVVRALVPRHVGVDAEVLFDDLGS